MGRFDYDLFVIGAGSAGIRVARTSAMFGAKVAIAEDRYLGGTCVNVGCIPKKLFVYASEYAEELEYARKFGWDIETPLFRWPVLLGNKARELGRLNGIYQGLLDDAGVVVLWGQARLLDEHTVFVEGQGRITARYIIIATGGWPRIPELPGREHILSSNDFFHLTSLPKRLIIVGGGYIAVEFAGIAHGLGIETSLIYRRPLFLQGFDVDLRAALASEMRKKGITLCFECDVLKIAQHPDGLRLTLGNGAHMSADAVIYATGRRPMSGHIGLQSVGVMVDEQGAIKVNQHYQTNIPSIYAIGDVIDRVKLTPVALAEARVLAGHLFNHEQHHVEYANIPTCVFSQPNLASVGLTELVARRDYGDDNVAIYQSSLRTLRHAFVGSAERAFIKLVVNKKDDRVLGAHMLGPYAGEIIQGIGIAIKAGATKAIFDETIGIHPTLAEEFVSLRE